MRFHTEYLTFNTKMQRDYVNITGEIEAALTKSGIREGMILVSAMHITASVYINDAENGLIQDIDEWLERLAPYREDYRHHRTGETNGDAHLKNLLLHHQVIVPVTDGRLDLGTWQQIYYAEFDGQRRKRVTACSRAWSRFWRVLHRRSARRVPRAGRRLSKVVRQRIGDLG